MGKIGLWIVDRYRAVRKKCGKPPVSPVRLRRCRQLYPGEEPEQMLRSQDGALISRAILIFAGGAVLWTVFWLTRERPEALVSLERPDYGEEAVYYSLEVLREKGDTVSVEVPVRERACTEAEARERISQAYEEISRAMLGDNESAARVTSDLNLPGSALDGTVEAEWISRTRELLDDWGMILKEPGEISEEGEEGRYSLELSCGTVSCLYEISVTVYPPERSEQEQLADMTLREIAKQEETQGQSVTLPAEYQGEQLKWYEKQDQSLEGLLLVLPVLLPALLFAGRRQRQKERMRLREREMLLDYPELVSRFAVLIQAGMTTRNVWERMVREYEEKKKGGGSFRYAYEEMKLTLSQLKNGVYESVAYGEFGRRCGLHPYLKFGALLEQNLKQGNGGLAAQLEAEAGAAFEERKTTARRLGEEAQTKLMLPMFMMLAVVLAVVMIPAFLSF